MIPKKIHYCWFSGEAFPANIQKCLDSWKSKLPDYELILWDERKARLIGLTWISEALDQKKYAFAADAVRLYALFTEGGIYLDCDVEVVRNFEDLLQRNEFFGYENGSKRIEGAVLGAEAYHPAIGKALDFYKCQTFSYNEDKVDSLVLPNILAKAFQKFPNLEIFDESYFSPKSFINGKIRSTKDTYCIHHFSSSWRPVVLQKGIARRQWIYAKFPAVAAKPMAKLLAVWTNIQNLGLKGTLKKIQQKH